MADTDFKAEKKKIQDEKKKLRDEQKARQKEAKKRAKELADQEAELDDDAPGGGFSMFIITLFIILIVEMAIGMVLTFLGNLGVLNYLIGAGLLSITHSRKSAFGDL